MAISREDVLHVARLARLEVPDDELEAVSEQLGAILEAVGKVSELDLSDVAPTSHPLDLVNVWDEDEPRPSLSQEVALANAPGPGPGDVPRPQRRMSPDSLVTLPRGFSLAAPHTHASPAATLKAGGGVGWPLGPRSVTER